jgi:hypothetical protein
VLEKEKQKKMRCFLFALLFVCVAFCLRCFFYTPLSVFATPVFRYVSYRTHGATLEPVF